VRPESRRVAARTGSWNGFWIVVLIDVLWGMGLSTQFVAVRLGYHHHLGTPWLPGPLVAKGWLDATAVACTGFALACVCTRRWRAGGLAWGVLAVSAMVLRSGPVYSPLRIFVWYGAYRRIPEYTHLFRTAWVILASSSIALVIASWRLLELGHRAVEPTDESSLHRERKPATTERAWSARSQGPPRATTRLRTAGRRHVPLR
jgi:hypothetical protein